MDIFLHNLPYEASHHEVRLFLRSKLWDLDIVAFDVVKRRGKNNAIVTIADRKKAQAFLNRYAGRGCLILNGIPLLCAESNCGQADPLKIRALQVQEETLRRVSRKEPNLPSVVPISGLQIGAWAMGSSNRLAFNPVCKGLGDGTVTFGTSALVVCLRVAGPQQGYDPYSAQYLSQDAQQLRRIDIPYSIVEHVITSEIGTPYPSSMTFTLKIPPKIYELVPFGPATKSLRRLCTITLGQEMSTALSMVYRLIFPNVVTAMNAAKSFARFRTSLKQYCFTTFSTEFPSQIEMDYHRLEGDLVNAAKNPALEFNARFQLAGLVFEGKITPVLAVGLLPSLNAIAEKYGSRSTADAIRKYGREMPTLDPSDSTTIAGITHTNIRIKIQEDARIFSEVLEALTSQPKTGSFVATYRAVVTPTSLILRGPDMATPNRVLRRFSEYSEYFLRVSFADEDGRSIFPGHSDCAKVYDRFGRIGFNGLHIAGRRYGFLGFSHSSLRDQTAWFMAPFLHGGKTILASDIIKSLGDFNDFRCVAKCAARIGQAFSDTMFAIPLPAEEVGVIEGMADVERDGRCFSDGCGTISQALLERVWKGLPRDRRAAKPTVLQIRYKGAKGVVSLDTNLVGEQLCLRQSMIKFDAGADWRDLEICDASYSPLHMFLNHQFINILEDLGVPNGNFIALQDEEIGRLKSIVDGPHAANFLEARRCATTANMPALVKLLHDIGISYRIDPFLTGVMEIAVTASLRDIKYRARIPVEKGLVLFGIMDETNILKEGEVYIQTVAETRKSRKVLQTLIQDRVVVTRAPALHPGDIQVVSAVDVPAGSPLKALYNCIVFSQQGARDLPSQLGGGDLDGDQFHIIYDKRLIPRCTERAAEYPPNIPMDHPTPIEKSDIFNFFVYFLQSNRLGQISNEHKVRADAEPEGTKHWACKQLAQMGSDAVDFSKSGRPVDMTQRPEGGRRSLKPDFMAPRLDLQLVNKSIVVKEANFVDPNDPDSVDMIDPDSSPEKILGVLYRRVNLSGFITRMQRNLDGPRSQMPPIDLMQILKSYIDKETIIYQWEHHREFAEEIREFYEENMLETMNSFRLHQRGEPLQELEVFTGNIIGTTSRDSNHAIFEAQSDLRERFNHHVSSCIRRIVHGDERGDEEEALPRAIACFRVALETEGWEIYKELESWRYVTAAVCLEELWKERGYRLRPFGHSRLVRAPVKRK
ncbi:rna-dependent rna polymeras-like protein [Amniculicola lignicola CBS 123094]|uniref:RNA-dependent RNA polymerase n=1 Tax=Amniculicola lignicola CBS 123094 TaxID=1392246 RepID=A0A6A5X4V7_9PLEO|nr:rna-dependent rna polymeras-like protein [Amniculicola lignicola CBS 123094]